MLAVWVVCNPPSGVYGAFGTTRPTVDTYGAGCGTSCGGLRISRPTSQNKSAWVPVRVSVRTSTSFLIW